MENMKFFAVILAASIFIGASLGIYTGQKSEGRVIEKGDFRHLLHAEQVLVYGTTWCEYCAKLFKYLDTHNIEYRFMDVEASETNKQAFEKLSGESYPLTVTPRAIIRGYNQEKLETSLIEQGFLGQQ